MTAAIGRRMLSDADAVAAAAVGIILDAAREAIAKRGRFSLVLAGGRTPQAVYRRLREAHETTDGWWIFFGDERCLPPTDPGRNSLAAQNAWLADSGIREDRIHWIPAEQGPELGAALYAEDIAAWQPFDLVLLGMGEDGHVASLFPRQDYPDDRLVVPVHHAPKPPPDRVSLGYGAICNARRRLLLVTGSGKRAALAAWQRGEDLPVTRVDRCGPLVLLLDEAAEPPL